MEKKNRGFTLVEMIVVLVILSVVAAIAVPALLGFIDKGKERECQSVRESILGYFQTDWMIESSKGEGGRSAEQLLKDEIENHDLECPSGGKYENIDIKFDEAGKVDSVCVHCSVHDANIYYYVKAGKIESDS